MMKRLSTYLVLFAVLVGCGGNTPPAGNDPAPTASFTFSSQGLTVSVDASSSSATNTTITDYRWTFGDGASGSGLTASHTYSSAGTYAVTLFVTDARGSTATAQQTVSVSAPSQQPTTGTVQGALSFGATAGGAEFIPGELIVMYESDRITTMSTELRTAEAVISLARPLTVEGAALYRNSSLTAEETLALAAELRARPDVQHVLLNTIMQPLAVPNDAYYGLQWHYPAMNLPAAWDITTGSADTVVAVVDSGILWHPTNPAQQHPDFAGKVLPGYDFISDTRFSNDGDGRDPDPFDPGDSTDPRFNSSFHGSHVAGTIAAATNNNEGVAGVNWHASILPVRVLGQGGGSMLDVYEGMMWAAGLSISGVPDNPNPARIINMSLGVSNPCEPGVQAFIQQVLQQGVIVVVAAGNAGEDAANMQPANCPGVITVGAVDIGNSRAPYSNYGTVIDVMAPGGYMEEDLNKDGYPDGVLSINYGDYQAPYGMNYVFEHGTSMAAPHVSGLISLMLALDPDLTAGQALYALTGSATPMSAAECRRPNISECGAGRVDALAALQLVQAGNLPDAGPPVTPGPPGQPGPAAPSGPVLVAALQEAADEYELVGSQTVDAPFSSYSFESPAGPVYLVAWSDEDGDGTINAGDFYGEYPQQVTVQAGTTLTGLDIHLERLGPGATGMIVPASWP